MNKGKKERKEDFQVQAYQLLYRTLKKLHTFKIQKVVRKLKKDNQRKQELVNEGGDQAVIDKITTEVERLIKQKGKMDLVTKDCLKMITLYNLNQVHNVSLEKDKEFFEKELPGFVDKIELFNDEGNEVIQLIKWFEETIKDHKVYLECQQKLEMLVSTMEQIMEKNKTRRKTRKQNKKLRMKQGKEESINGISNTESVDNGDGMNIEQGEDDEEDQDIVIEDEDEDMSAAPKKQEGKKRQSERYKNFKENKEKTSKEGRNDDRRNSRNRSQDDVFKNQKGNGRDRSYNDRRDRSATNERFNNRDNRGDRRDNRNDRERGPRNNQRDFKDKGFSRGRKEFGEKRRPNQEFSEERIEKKVKGEDRKGGFRDNKTSGGFGKDNKPTEKVRPFEQLHPSWKARIELKQKATIATFQGTKEKL